MLKVSTMYSFMSGSKSREKKQAPSEAAAVLRPWLSRSRAALKAKSCAGEGKAAVVLKCNLPPARGAKAIVHKLKEQKAWTSYVN